jgi:hypothetical protein
MERAMGYEAENSGIIKPILGGTVTGFLFFIYLLYLQGCRLISTQAQTLRARIFCTYVKWFL